MKQIYWIDIADEKPEKDQWIFYIDTKVAEWHLKNPQYYSFSADDVDRGSYVRDNLVEWHYDLPCEEFKYWYPIPQMIKESV
jgi:hypothetical protein